MKKGILTYLLAFAIAYSGCCAPPSFASNDPIFVSADMLVWRFREGSADNWAQDIAPSGRTQTAKIIDAPFDWNVGFRLGIGYNWHSVWSTALYYTRFQSTASSRATGRIFSGFLGNFFANNTNGANFGPHYRDAQMKWKIFFNTLDLDFARAFKTKQGFVIKPFVGVKTAVINQDMNTNWEGPLTTVLGVDVPITTFSTATEDLENNFIGVGPSIGFDMTFPIIKLSKSVFNIVGHLSGALLWGHWSFKDLYKNNTPVSIAVNLSDINGAAPMGRGLIGLEWAGYISTVKVNVRLLYEGQVWLNQMQFYYLSTGRLNNLMSLQGGVLDFTLNF